MSPLADERFRRLYAAQVIALAGTGFSTIALALLAYELAGDNAGAVLGTAFALKMIAYVGIAPVVGGCAHLLPRRSLLVGLDIVRALCIGCFVFVDAVWQIYLLIFLLNACSAGFTPTFQATIPDILPDEARYTRALSLSRLAYDLENLLSPMLAAAALAVLSFDALFSANALAFAVSALLVGSVAFPAAPFKDRTEGVWRRTTFGVAAYLATPRLRGLLALSLAVACGGAMVIVNTVVLVAGRIQGSETDTALAYAAAGAGSMGIALLLPRMLDRIPDRPAMLAGGALLSAALLMGLTDPGFPVLLAIWLALGAGASLIQTPAGRLLKRSAAEGEGPALFAAQFALSHACWLCAYPLAGWLGNAAGMEAAFLALGLCAAAATLTAWISWPKDDPVTLRHRHDAVEHDHLHVHDDHHQHDHDHTGIDPTKPHRHPHRHDAVEHEHAFAIDLHHPVWPTR